MAIEKWVYSATTTTAVSVASNMTSGQVAGNNSVVDNSSELYPYADAVLFVNGFGSAPSANTAIELWAVPQDVDGTSDCTAGNSITSTPSSPTGLASTDGAVLAAVFPLAASTSSQRVIAEIRTYPKAKYFIRNQSGVTVNAGAGTETTVKITPKARQIV